MFPAGVRGPQQIYWRKSAARQDVPTPFAGPKKKKGGREAAQVGGEKRRREAAPWR
jgi:hypothetical protein